MTKGPKGVAQKHDRLPARPPDADPLQVYCPDLEQWARSWSYEPRDIPPGLQVVEYFKPFLRHLLTLDLSRPTLRRHRDNLWALGGEIIHADCRWTATSANSPSSRSLAISSTTRVTRCSPMALKAEQRAFDATCRKFSRFLAAVESSRSPARETLN